MNSSSRIEVVDALRAFALIGISVAHAYNEYIGGSPLDYSNRYTLLDQIVGQITDYLVFGKFFTIFSFLFGFSFWLQVRKPIAEGEPYALRFVWRLVILFVIGYIHTLFYIGDILTIYAVAGLLLIPASRLSTGTLLVAGMLLVCNLPTQMTRVYSYVQESDPASLAAEKKFMDDFNRQAWQDLKIKRDDSWTALVRWNFQTALPLKAIFQLYSGRIFITLGLFLLGIVAARERLLDDTPAHRRWMQRALWWAAPVAALSTILTHRWNPTLFGSVHEFYGLLGLIAFDVQQVSLSLTYGAAFILLYWHMPGKPVEALAQIGRMGLTVYLLLSVSGLWMFYGFGLGLLTRLGTTTGIGLGLLAATLTGALAWTWMQYFRMGPVEWFWRCATKGRWEPLRRATNA